MTLPHSPSHPHDSGTTDINISNPRSAQSSLGNIATGVVLDSKCRDVMLADQSLGVALESSATRFWSVFIEQIQKYILYIMETIEQLESPQDSLHHTYNVPNRFKQTFYWVFNRYFATVVQDLDSKFRENRNLFLASIHDTLFNIESEINAMMYIYYRLSCFYGSLHDRALSYMECEWVIRQEELSAMAQILQDWNPATMREYIEWLWIKIKDVAYGYLQNWPKNHAQRMLIRIDDCINWIESSLSDWMNKEKLTEHKALLEGYIQHVNMIQQLFTEDATESLSTTLHVDYHGVDLDKLWLLQHMTFSLVFLYMQYFREMDEQKKKLLYERITRENMATLSILAQIKEDHIGTSILNLPIFDIQKTTIQLGYPWIEIHKLKKLYECVYADDSNFLQNILPWFEKEWKEKGGDIYFLYDTSDKDVDMTTPIASCRISEYPQFANSKYLSAVNIDPSYQGLQLSAFAVRTIDEVFGQWIENIYLEVVAWSVAEKMWHSIGFHIVAWSSYDEIETGTIHLMHLDRNVFLKTISPGKSVETLAR